jgi:hypothetical protein
VAVDLDLDQESKTITRDSNENSGKRANNFFPHLTETCPIVCLSWFVHSCTVKRKEKKEREERAVKRPIRRQVKGKTKELDSKKKPNRKEKSARMGNSLLSP